MNLATQFVEIPTAAECEAILAGQYVAHAVIRHSRKVAEVALQLAAALVRTGVALNLDLVQAAALLHDLAKGQPDHAAAGAAILCAMDCRQVAAIVAAHTDLDFSNSDLDEKAIVYLADKLVCGEERVTIDQRFQPALDRFRNEPAAFEAATRRMNTAKEVLRAVETRLGVTIAADTGTGDSMGLTVSVCPVCLRRIAAERVAEGDTVYLRKTCPEHGVFKTVIWRGLSTYRSWGAGNRTPSKPAACGTRTEHGCPYDCGLCPDHRQHTCCVVLDVTERCNLACPVCFASASAPAKPDPSLDEIEAWCRALLVSSGPVGIHLSGGEPTVRRDLPQLIRRIRVLGFQYIQLNTNGVRLAREQAYAGELKAAGLSTVFLQFDGVRDEVFQAIRGRALFDTKLAAIRNCGQQKLGVVLVPTLVPGVNTGQIGDILRTAIALAPAVRAVHFQPVSYFGRYPAPPRDCDRITIPEIIRLIDEQTAGEFSAANFYPPSGENPYCSFHGKFWLYPGGRIEPAARPATVSCCGPAPEAALVQLGAATPKPGEGARRAQRFVAQHWTFPAGQPAATGSLDGIDISSFEAFLTKEKQSFCISGMAFQDAWNLDLERLRECFLHVLSPEQKLVPLCAYNLTGIGGQTLYRPQSAARAGSGAIS